MESESLADRPKFQQHPDTPVESHTKCTANGRQHQPKQVQQQLIQLAVQKVLEGRNHHRRARAAEVPAVSMAARARVACVQLS